MRTWIIIDLLLVGALVGAWLAWRVGKRRFEAAAQLQPTADEATPLGDAHDVATPEPESVEVPRTQAEASPLQVIVDVAHGRGEELLESLSRTLGISSRNELVHDEATGGANAPASQAESPAGGAELQPAPDASGPLGADRLVFHTESAPSLLNKVLVALRDRGYGIEMVVHHEVILHDVDAGVARVGVERVGNEHDDAGIPPTAVVVAPIVV